MKYIYNILSILCALCLFACTAEDEMLNDGGVGYLRLTVGGSNETTTKAATLPDDYTGLQIAVEIVDAEGETIEKTDDWEEWKGESIALKAGKYTIKAHSYGFDGKQSAMAAPYYYGSKEITIENGKELNETVTCKLANVKMSVKVSDDIKAKFKSFSVSVDPKTAGACDPLSFNIDLTQNAISDTAYFPVTDLIVNYSAINKSDKKNTATKELTGVKGNDHYILNFTLAERVDVDDPVSVVVDPTMQTYTYTFYVSTTPTNNATVSANAWAKMAYLTATDITTTSGTDISTLKFQYKLKSAGDDAWIDATATEASGVYTGKTGALEASTTYECRLVNAGGSFQTSPITFTTEAAAELYNGGFDNWCQSNGVLYAITEEDAQKNGSDSKGYLYSFWDSGNVGASTMGINPTQGDASMVHTQGEGKMSAKLASTWVGVDFGLGKIGKFAAGNLYIGHYVETVEMDGAKINFGQSFEARPTALKGYLHYTPGSIDYKGDNQPANTVEIGNTDINSIFIALTKEIYPIDNTNPTSGLFDKNDERVIAYGELPASECGTTKGQWKEFNIPLEYKSLTVKPKYIIIVCSASKYGDYFTGSSKSVMYLDDFELIYEGEPEVWENL